MPRQQFKNKTSELKIAERKATIIDLLLQGLSQNKIAPIVGVSQVQVCRDLKEVVGEWRESYLQDIDTIKGKEVARIEHLISKHWEEFEESKYREVPEKRDKSGKIISKAIKKRVPGNIEYLVAIRECIAQLWKLYGIAQDINLSATQNNVNVGNTQGAPLGSPGSIPAGQFPWQLLFGKPTEVDSEKDPIEAEIRRILDAPPQSKTGQLFSTLDNARKNDKLGELKEKLEEVEASRNGDEQIEGHTEDIC